MKSLILLIILSITIKSSFVNHDSNGPWEALLMNISSDIPVDGFIYYNPVEGSRKMCKTLSTLKFDYENPNYYFIVLPLSKYCCNF